MTVDRNLLVRISRGDELAFQELLDKYSALVYTRVMSITRNAQMAEELLQDVFIDIWRSREALPNIENIEAYLNVLARNKGINALNKIIRERMLSRGWQADQNLPETSEEIYFDLLDAAIAQLSPQQKKVWVMNRRLRMTYGAIAVQLDLSRDAVKKYLQTATRKVSAFLVQHIDKVPLIFFWTILYNIFRWYPLFLFTI